MLRLTRPIRQYGEGAALVAQALQLSRTVAGEHDRIDLLARLARLVHDQQRESILREIWEVVSDIESDILRAAGLSHVAYQFAVNARVLNSVITKAECITNGARRAEVLVTAATQLGSAERSALLAEALDMIPDSGDDIELGQALRAIARAANGTPEILREVVAAATGLYSGAWRSTVLRAAAWRLSQYAAGRDTYPSWDAGLAYKVSVQLGDAAEDV